MKTKLLILIFSLSITCKSQDNLKYATYNIISNGIIGGFGNCITHNKINGKNFIKGFKKGCIAGSMIYSSKLILKSQVNKDYFETNWKLFWSSKFLNSIGNSLLKNAVLDNGLLNNFSFEIGFIRLNLNKNYPIQLEPISLSCMAYMIFKGGKIDIQKSLSTGTLTFNNKFARKYHIDTISHTIKSKPKHFGMELGNNIMIHKNLNGNNVFIHEIIHTYQRMNLFSLNQYFHIYKKYENLNKFIYNDISSYDILYFIQLKTIGYNNNIFEKEANFFSK